MIDFTVAVVGGTGSKVVDPYSFGRIALCCINCPPLTTPTYGYTVVDKDGFGLAGLSNLDAGSNTIVERYSFITGGTFSIVHASVDGTYYVRLYESTDVR